MLVAVSGAVHSFRARPSSHDPRPSHFFIAGTEHVGFGRLQSRFAVSRNMGRSSRGRPRAEATATRKPRKEPVSRRNNNPTQIASTLSPNMWVQFFVVWLIALLRTRYGDI